MTGAKLIASVNDCDAGEPTPLLACSVNVNGAPVAFGGVPAITPVVEFNVAQLGNVPPTTENVGAGEPLAEIANTPETPTVKVALLALLLMGGVLTVSVTGSLAMTPKLFEMVT